MPIASSRDRPEDTKMLAAASEVVDKGNTIVLNRKSSYIENDWTGKRIPLYRRKGVYVFDVWLDRPREAKTSKENRVRWADMAPMEEELRSKDEEMEESTEIPFGWQAMLP